MRCGRVLVPAVVVLTGAVTGAAAGQAGDATGGAADPGWEVVQCLANPRPILGTAAVYRLLVANHTDGELFVSVPVIHDGVSEVTYPGYVRNCANGEKGIIVGMHVVEPDATQVWNYTVPMPFTSRAVHVGPQRLQVEFRIAKGVVGIGDEVRAAGIATTESKAGEDVMIARVAKETYGTNPRVYEGGRVYTFEGEYEVIEPAERDRAFYEAYVEPSLALGDCWWSGEAKWKQDSDRRAMAEGTEEQAAAQTSFEVKAASPLFKRFQDNGYYAFTRSLRSLANSRNNHLEEVASRLAPPRANPFDVADRRTFLEVVAIAAEARHFVDITPLAWDWYLSRAPYAYLRTTQHERGIEILKEIAAETPDCVTRYLATELLRRHAALRAAAGDDATGGGSE